MRRIYNPKRASRFTQEKKSIMRSRDLEGSGTRKDDAMLDRNQHNFQPTKIHAASTNAYNIHIKGYTNVFRKKTKTLRRERGKND